MHLLFALFWAAFFTTIAHAGAPETITLAIGEQTTIGVSQGARFSVGNLEVLEVKPTQKEGGEPILLLKGKRQGYSDLLILEGKDSRQLSIRVYTKKEGALLRDVNTTLRGAPGLEVLPGGSGWVVRGQIENMADMQLLTAMKQLSGGKVAGSPELHALERMRVEGKIRKRLRASGVDGVKVRGAGSQIFLEGEVRSIEEKNKAELLAREVFPSVVSQMQHFFDARDVVRFRVRMLEISRSNRVNAGLKWTDSLPGILQIQKNLLKSAFSLDASLSALQERGLVRILSQPEIAMNADGTAELKVGGEIPIALQGKNYLAVQWKPYGLVLGLEVPGMSHNKIRTKIKVDMTTLDAANSAGGIPATRLSQLHTVVDLKLGKTLFLSGLVQEMQGKNYVEVPGLASIPIFGELFRSRDFQDRKSELVVALTAERAED